LPDKEQFAFAGLWSEWHNKVTGETKRTFTILTTEANELMSKIHNTKKRMPIILSKNNEPKWLLEGQGLILENNRLVAEKA
jgi:putative SOS response-associated peptidase YedK